ncbi:hypothetical protein [Paenibacillus ginsengihumi]|uniref:hypothetical protein n=1 Tax=Paenibacillus ginsengihumi TaxID=431596 RepID=UPI0003725709|nr:hypothetical protein [Paenibacillus ginsengihumi]
MNNDKRFLDRRLCPLAQHHQKMKKGRGSGAIFKIDAHAAGAAPSEDENGPPALGAIFKIDAYDERFLASSVVTCGIEKSAYR